MFVELIGYRHTSMGDMQQLWPGCKCRTVCSNIAADSCGQHILPSHNLPLIASSITAQSTHTYTWSLLLRCFLPNLCCWLHFNISSPCCFCCSCFCCFTLSSSCLGQPRGWLRGWHTTSSSICCCPAAAAADCTPCCCCCCCCHSRKLLLADGFHQLEHVRHPSHQLVGHLLRQLPAAAAVGLSLDQGQLFVGEWWVAGGGVGGRSQRQVGVVVHQRGWQQQW